MLAVVDVRPAIDMSLMQVIIVEILELRDMIKPPFIMSQRRTKMKKPFFVSHHTTKGRQQSLVVLVVAADLADPLQEDTDKLMDERAGRTRLGPYPGYAQRYIELVKAAMRDCARRFGWPLTYQVDPEVLSGGPAMSSGGRHGGSGGQLLPRLPTYARSNERFDGDT